jgi:hypothetical protein
MCHTARSSLRRGPGVLSMGAHGGESEGPRHRTGWSAMQGEVARTSRHMTHKPAHITGGAFCTRMPCTLPCAHQPSLKPTRESALRLQLTSSRFGGGGSVAPSSQPVEPKVSGDGEWRRFPGDGASRSARTAAVKRDSLTRKRTARKWPSNLRCTFRWCAALRRALRRCLAVCRSGWGALAACCAPGRSDMLLPCRSVRRNGVPLCLAAPCQLVTERMMLPCTTRSVTSTFHAPSRAARRRCTEAHRSNGSTSRIRSAPAAAAVAVRSPRSSIQVRTAVNLKTPPTVSGDYTAERSPFRTTSENGPAPCTIRLRRRCAALFLATIELRQQRSSQKSSLKPRLQARAGP